MLRLVLAVPILMLTGACGGGSASNDARANAVLVLSRNEAGRDKAAAANVIAPAQPLALGRMPAGRGSSAAIWMGARGASFRVGA